LKPAGAKFADFWKSALANLLFFGRMSRVRRKAAGKIIEFFRDFA
jgi:hypothetical protein